MTGELRIDSASDGSGRKVVRVAGDVDLDNVHRFTEAIGADGVTGSVVVDLTDVTYLDSSGVAALFRRAKQGGLELVIADGCVVASLVELSHLGELATVRSK